MLKIMKNQWVHRFKHTKYIWILYVVFLLCYAFTSNPRISASYLKQMSNENVIAILFNQRNFVFFFIVILIAMFAIYALYLFKDYKTGLLRWYVLTNNRYAIVLADGIYIFICALVLYILSVIGLYFIILQRLELIKEAGVYLSEPYRSIEGVILYTLDTPQLYSKNIGDIGRVVCGLAFFSQAMVCVGHMFIFGKENKKELVLLGIMSIVIVNLVTMVQAWLMSVVYILGCIIYIIFTSKAWKLKGGNLHVRS